MTPPTIHTRTHIPPYHSNSSSNTIVTTRFFFSFSRSFTSHYYYHYSHTPGTRQIGKATLTLHRGLGSRGR